MDESTDKLTLVEVLIAARAVIDTPCKWTKRAAAKNHLGDKVLSTSSDAVKWCARGALYRTSSNLETFLEAVRLLDNACGMPIDKYQDRHSVTHYDVMRIFDRAIDEAMKERGPT